MRIVSIATHLPYVGIPHAGGEHYLRHAEMLSGSHDLTVICPWTPANAAAMAEPVRGCYQRVVVVPRTRRGVIRRGARRSLLSRALPFLTMSTFLRAVLTDPRLVELLRRADLIELQWFDAVGLAARLSRVAPGTPIIGYFHDVPSQAYRRGLLARGVSLPRRLLALSRLGLSAPVERRAMRVLDTAVVFSDKDRALLARRGTNIPVLVALPPLDDDDMPRAPRTAPPPSPDVLFVGAMWRPENEDAALWLLREIWPRVRRAVPEAHLTIAGASPTVKIQEEVDRAEAVALTGRVASLTPFYRRAAVAVVPLRLGAGVKFKSVVALLLGVPVVATTVGAEGIGGPGLFLAVEDDSTAFATAVAKALREPAEALAVAAEAYEWAHDRYTSAAYRRALAGLYDLPATAR